MWGTERVKSRFEDMEEIISQHAKSCEELRVWRVALKIWWRSSSSMRRLYKQASASSAQRSVPYGSQDRVALGQGLKRQRELDEEGFQWPRDRGTKIWIICSNRPLKRRLSSRLPEGNCFGLHHHFWLVERFWSVWTYSSEVNTIKLKASDLGLYP